MKNRTALLFSVVSLFYVSSILTSAQLVSYWNFDDGETVTDQVGPNHGTVLDDVEFSEETPNGSAYSLDLLGAKDYVRIGPASPNGPDFGISETGSFTISFWVNYEFSQRGIVTVKNDVTSRGGDRSGFTVGIDEDGYVFVGIIPSVVPSGGNDEANGGPYRDITTDLEVPLETWTHLAVTYDGGTDTLAVYMDGEAATMYSSNAADSPADDGSNATGGVGKIDFIDSNGSFTGFGASGSAYGREGRDFTRLYYDGLLDEVAIWNIALEAQYIVALAEGEDPREVISDSDEDGLTDDYEEKFAFLDPQNPDDAAMDEDKDGLSNLEESKMGTVPNDADSDDDGLMDGEEVNTYDTDPMKADSDGDDLNDNLEIAEMTDPNAPDSDGDMLTDGEEVNTHKTNPRKSDSDDDGVDDGKEIAWGSNPNDAGDVPWEVGRVGLISYWNFDDGETVTDQVGPNHGTVLNDVAFSEDTPDGSAHSLDLRSSHDYVRIGPESPHGPDFGIPETGSFSISLWANIVWCEKGIVTVKHDLTSGGGDRSGITFGISPSGKVFVGMIASTGDENGDAANGGATYRDINTHQRPIKQQWVHLAVTYDRETDTLVTYLDGDPATQYSRPREMDPAILPDGTEITEGTGIDFVDSDGSFTGFGASGNAPQHDSSAGDFTRIFYDGLLDEVGIWNIALSEEEVIALAEGAVPTEFSTPPAPFLIKDILFEAAKKQATIVWNSRPERTYVLEASSDLVNWEEIDDGILSDGTETKYIETNIAVENKVRFYRLKQAQ